MAALPQERSGAAPARQLLALDPDLGQLLDTDRREAAERELRVRTTRFPIGEWDGGRLADADPLNLGLLVVDGVLAREVVLSDNVSTELLGPGDIVRPGASRARRSCCRSRSAGTRWPTSRSA